MAVLSSNWYQGSIPKAEITEVRITSVEFAGDADSWDASTNHDGSIMCHRIGTKVKVVCSGVTAIEDNAFDKFLALKKVSGLGSVTAIGAFAFCYTPNLVSIDLVPQNITIIGESAFRMSGAEDNLNLSGVSTSVVGDKATRSKRWSSSTLSAVQSVAFPRTIYLNVPNPDSQENYSNVPIATKNGETLYTDRHGCTALAAYHMWNCVNAGTPKEYGNWLEWFDNTINSDGQYAVTNHHDTQTEPNILAKLGWTDGGEVQVSDSQQLQTIINRLVAGIPTYAVIHSTNTPDGTHSIVIVGCDAETHKLAVVDSAAIGNTGVISWVAFEDVFVDGTNESDRIRLCNFNRPVLAPNSTWFTQGGTTIKRASITEIFIEDEYTPTGAVTSSWDASASKDGSIMAYVSGTKLTLAGNGSGKIALNDDSRYAFSDVNKTEFFENLTEIHNTNLLDAAGATLFTNMFDACLALRKFDGTGWNTGNVTSLQAMFQNCTKLEALKIRDWDTGNVTLLNALLNMSGSYTNECLKELDLSGWNVKKATGTLMLFSQLRVLETLKLTGWEITASTNFTMVFNGLYMLKELDLSGWDTSASTNMTKFINNVRRLEKIIFGEKFSFNGNGSLTGSNVFTMPTPDGGYIDGADGNWYDVHGIAHSPSSVPNKTFGIWYATKDIADEDANQVVLVKKGSLMKTASAIRTKAGSNKGYTPAEFQNAILSIGTEGQT